MPRTKSTDIMIRDKQIAEEAGEGVSRRVLARKYGVSEARISQIVLQEQEKISDDAARATLEAQLEFALGKALALLCADPQQKVTPSGKLVYMPLMDEHGERLRNSRCYYMYHGRLAVL